MMNDRFIIAADNDDNMFTLKVCDVGENTEEELMSKETKADNE